MSNYMIHIILLLLKKKKKKIDSFDFWCFVVTFIDKVGAFVNLVSIVSISAMLILKFRLSCSQFNPFVQLCYPSPLDGLV